MPSFAYSIARFWVAEFKPPFVIIETEPIFAGDWPIGKRRSDAHNASRFLFKHLFHSALSDVEESEQIGGDKRIEVLGSEISTCSTTPVCMNLCFA